jgi:TrpR family trp operon transcriptional repressor
MNRSDAEPDGVSLDQIVDVLCQIRDRQEMGQFLQEILTPAELHDLALRWELMRRLAQGDAQRQIAGEMGVSLCKITRGAKILKKEDSITHTILFGKKTV